MATRLLSLSQKVVTYQGHSLKALSLRCISNQNRGSSESSEQPTNPSQVEAGERGSKWLNIHAGIFGPDDERLPLPGDVGLSQNLYDLEMNNNEENPKLSVVGKEFPTMIQPLKLEPFSSLPRGEFSSSSLASNQEEMELQEVEVNSFLQSNEAIIYKEKTDGGNSCYLECRVQKCPELLKRDFQTLFPGMNFTKHSLTVMTLCQKTVNDMSFWSEEMEVEREELLQQFVECARKICEDLRAQNYWADFIDPTSGRPFLGPFTNSTFFETDERYRYFGYIIEDLGCCKVISHRLWGHQIFVGALFTTAPVNSDVIETALRSSNIEKAS